MSSRFFLKPCLLSALPTLVLGLCLSGAAFAAGNGTPSLEPTVQTYVDQAAPASGTPSQDMYDSPLSAGTLTLQDVLEAHKNVAPVPQLPSIGTMPPVTATAPMLKPPTQSSSTSLMMSQGMKEVLQKVGNTSVAPVQARPHSAAVQAQGQPTPLVQPSVPGAPDLKYEPGQAPKDLVTGAPIAASVAQVPSLSPSTVDSSSPASSLSSSGDQSCDQNVQKWEKSCGDAGYPATYVGKIVGETRTGCSDGVLHDVWVSNSCAPTDAATAMTSKTDGQCGAASNNEFDDPPSGNLCAQGVPGGVSGSGPWTWACSGVNGGSAAACTAPKRLPKVSGECGSANGIAVNTAPSIDLCDSGRATALSGSGPWTWSCRGAGGGTTQSCIAPVLPRSAAAVEEPVAVPSSVSSTQVPSVSSEKGDLCGAAAEILAYDAPSKDLCRVGTASVVNGDGPWTWACTDNDGRSSSCRTLSLNPEGAAAEPVVPKPAPEAPVESVLATSPRLQPQSSFLASPSTPSPELACGAAAGQPATQMPTTALCENGKASTVRGSNPWSWTCSDKAHHKVSCSTTQTLDGSCGAANGTALRSAPFSGLCATGVPTSIQGNGPWTWVCNGSGGGVNVSCAASLLPAKTQNTKIDGTCGETANASLPSIPNSGLCATGTPSAVSGQGPWTWSCSGTNGGVVSSCSATKLAPPTPPGPTVNGLCGGANGVMTTATPADGLCAGGNSTSVVGNGPWNWSCIGENGGMSVSCTAPLEPPAPIDGECGAAGGVSTLVKPQSGLCAAGITGTVNGKGPWTWVCSGANGGSAASCVAPVAGKTGVMPSVTTVPVPVDPTLVEIPGTGSPRSGLVTPQLPSSGAMPNLDQKVLPQLTPSKSFASPPTPSAVPPVASIRGTNAPQNVPSLGDGSTPVQPPALRDSLPSAAVLQETPTVPHIPGNHLTLDPTLSTLPFTHGSGNIDPTILPTLDKLAAVLVGNEDVRITLTAYADNAGSTPRDARRLSLTRALAVRDYLGSKGISDSRIDVRAEGANTTTGALDRVDVRVND